MAKKKLGISSFDLNKQFKDINEARRYAKRLKEHIRSVCEKKANNGWSAQAMICISNTRGNTSYQYYEQTGKVGRPKRVKSFSDFNMKYYNGDMNVDWHLHILLVSKPSYAFREEIKRYIEKNRGDIKNSENEFDFENTILKRRVYKKNTNINKAEYFIDQADEILFCNNNNTNEVLIPKGYSLKELYKAYMKSRTAVKYCGKYREEEKWVEKEKIDNNYNRIKDFYYDLTKDEDKERIEVFMKQTRINKIRDNKVHMDNNVHEIDSSNMADNSLY